MTEGPRQEAGKPAAKLTRGAIVSIVAVGMLAGSAAGVGGYTFLYARGASYLSNDPAACANCHSMTDHYNAWRKSSHHAVATCNDCHTPHNFVGKYYVKAKNGWHHSVAFTLQNYHEPIQITPGNLEVTENACRHCHAELTAAIDSHVAAKAKGIAALMGSTAEPMSCTRCHAGVGHME